MANIIINNRRVDNIHGVELQNADNPSEYVKFIEGYNAGEGIDIQDDTISISRVGASTGALLGFDGQHVAWRTYTALTSAEVSAIVNTIV